MILRVVSNGNALTYAKGERCTGRALSAILLGFTALGLALRLLDFLNPINDWDEMTYALVARSLMLGDLPYHAAFDHKPIALYYVFAAFFTLFGYSVATIRLIPLVAIAATVWCLHRLAAHSTAPERRHLVLAGALFVATCGSFGNGGHATNTEIIAMPIIALWWLVAFRHRVPPIASWIGLGAITGIAAGINYLAGLIVASATALLVVETWVAERLTFAPLRHTSASARGTAAAWWGWASARSTPTSIHALMLPALYALMGFALASLLILSPLLANGAIEQYFAMQYAFLSTYRVPFAPQKLVRATGAVIWPNLIALVILLVGWRERRRLRPVAPAARRLWNIGVLMSMLTVVIVSLSNQLFPHYFNFLLVPSAVLLMLLLNEAPPPLLHAARFAVVVAAAGLVWTGAWVIIGRDLRHGFAQQQAFGNLAQRIAAIAKPNDQVFLFDIDQTIYVLANVRPASRFTSHRHFMFANAFLAKLGTSTEQEILKAVATRPVLVVACFDAMPAAAFEPELIHALGRAYLQEQWTGYMDCDRLLAFRRMR